jgi:hypothetical protein
VSAEPEDRAQPVDHAEHCPLCDAVVGFDAVRCPSCGMALAGQGARPSPFARRELWWSVAGLGVIYVIVLAIVALIR